MWAFRESLLRIQRWGFLISNFSLTRDQPTIPPLENAKQVEYRVLCLRSPRLRGRAGNMTTDSRAACSTKTRPCLKKSAMAASKILKQQYRAKHFVSLFKSSNGIFGNEVLSSASGLNNCCRKEKAKETATHRTGLGNKH